MSVKNNDISYIASCHHHIQANAYLVYIIIQEINVEKWNQVSYNPSPKTFNRILRDFWTSKPSVSILTI